MEIEFGLIGILYGFRPLNISSPSLCLKSFGLTGRMLFFSRKLVSSSFPASDVYSLRGAAGGEESSS